MAEKDTTKKPETTNQAETSTEVKSTAAKSAKELLAGGAAGAEDVAVKKVKKNKSKRTVTEGKAFIQSTFNNTIVTITDLNGAVLGWSSAGGNGFKGAKKATPYAAQVSAEAAVNKALQHGLEKLHVFVKGLGSGRDQAVRGLYASGVTIETITDVTPVAHNGCRQRKARRG